MTVSHLFVQHMFVSLSLFLSRFVMRLYSHDRRTHLIGILPRCEMKNYFNSCVFFLLYCHNQWYWRSHRITFYPKMAEPQVKNETETTNNMWLQNGGGNTRIRSFLVTEIGRKSNLILISHVRCGRRYDYILIDVFFFFFFSVFILCLLLSLSLGRYLNSRWNQRSDRLNLKSNLKIASQS